MLPIQAGMKHEILTHGRWKSCLKPWPRNVPQVHNLDGYSPMHMACKNLRDPWLGSDGRRDSSEIRTTEVPQGQPDVYHPQDRKIPAKRYSWYTMIHLWCREWMRSNICWKPKVIFAPGAWKQKTHGAEEWIFFFTLCGHEQVAIDLIARIL